MPNWNKLVVLAGQVPSYPIPPFAYLP